MMEDLQRDGRMGRFPEPGPDNARIDGTDAGQGWWWCSGGCARCQTIGKHLRAEAAVQKAGDCRDGLMRPEALAGTQRVCQRRDGLEPPEGQGIGPSAMG
jgi:hypothetical protein